MDDVNIIDFLLQTVSKGYSIELLPYAAEPGTTEIVLRKKESLLYSAKRLISNEEFEIIKWTKEKYFIFAIRQMIKQIPS